MKKLFYLSLLCCYFSFTQAQDLKKARGYLQKLTSGKFAGRGYVDSGDWKAAHFIAAEFSKLGLTPYQENCTGKGKKRNTCYFDYFNFNINTFPSDIVCAPGGKKLEPGIDFIFDAYSSTVYGNFQVIFLDREVLTKSDGDWFSYFAFNSTDYSRTVFAVDTVLQNDEKIKKRVEMLRSPNLYNGGKRPAAIIKLVGKQPIWTARQIQYAIPLVEVVADKFPPNTRLVRLEAEAQFKSYTSQNVLGIVKGAISPDTFIMVTAHYDHLGKMGKTIYPGANDNASGTSMMLDMASAFAKNPGRYSMLFVAFSGEEAGLIGSAHLAKLMQDTKANFPIPLRKVKFLLNLDLMGDGSKGVTAVNGEVFTEEFAILKSINTENHYLPEVAQRGKASNSDHHHFTEAGVRSFFFYLMGDYAYYHVPQDKAKALPFNNYENAFRLFEAFLRKL